MTGHNRRNAEVQWQAESFDKHEVEPQQYGEMKMQDNGLIRIHASTERWIASDMCVKAYR